MYKYKKILALFILFAIIIIGYGTILYIYNYPEAAIRRHLFSNNPSQSLTCTIKKTDIFDETYGQQYTIQGFTDPRSGGSIYFAYVKQNSLGLYYWSGGGSGP